MGQARGRPAHRPLPLGRDRRRAGREHHRPSEGRDPGGETVIRRTTVATLLTVPLLLSAAAPAHAAAPAGWELNAMDVPQAHRTSQGENVTVAVLDTGVVTSHPSFRGRVTSGPDFLRYGAEKGDPHWGEHGTAMASNVLSVAPKARVLSLRVILDHEDPGRDRIEEEWEKWRKGGTFDKELLPMQTSVSRAVRYAVDKGARVISMSLGTDEWAGFNDYLDDVAAAVDYAAGKGVVVLASSGNGGSTDRLATDANNVVSYPAAYAGVLGVAAVSPQGRRAEFSQVHTYNTIAAPGVDIRSATNTGGYRMVKGTSPACALAAGAVALMLSRNPDLSPRQVRDILVRTATKPPNGYTLFLGHGMVNADRAVRAAATAKGAASKAAAYEGEKHFGDGPTDSPITHPPIDQEYLVIGGVGIGIGLLCFAGTFFLVRRRRV
ncbi:serine protease [Nonomuraea deserti]|uniref:Serine protease n=1 Tax=Nonomuraea deserti TaxID=1848322 RepID=A0A4R4V702_9ACTN|nr:serine protease [Nonomuraea deserti]